ncbi:TetR/AcrR family transcriptional regulator [Enterococcus songbeiensis]|uniref:TetR/AcrR family transcriptional regulator n=1 Tax=Enterococcus songbeiensis TaxID=2559927 RepID=UPI0010F4FCDA|nr:TetR/AcrR family transcriptional regulator [Enterococcus songbeiensis]
MVRTKKIYRQHLLQGAFQLIVEQGFEQFHARNIAKKMACSTQPIYREFQTLQEYKQAAGTYILEKVEQAIQLSETTTLSELTENICSYAQQAPKEFQRFFLMDDCCRNEIKQVLRQHFQQLAPAEDFETFWYYTLGKAAVKSFEKIPKVLAK